MKKFLIVILSLTALLFGANYLIYHKGYYLVFNPSSEISVPFRTEEKKFQVLTEDGTYENIIFKSVDIRASIAGIQSTQFKATEDDYLRWFTQIAEMGANMVRAITIMDADFYNAFYLYNTTHEEPIYLLQGMGVSDRANDGPEDAYSETFYGSLVEDGCSLVDIIHGRKNIILASRKGTGFYRRDISQWVAGWLVGTEWNTHTIAYTDHSVIHDGEYQGTYFSTKENATSFEALMARVMDEIIEYESNKYRTQRPIGFINEQDSDFLEYQDLYAMQLNKSSQLDAEHIYGTEKLLSGQYAAYKIYDYCDDFVNYLTEEQLAELGSVVNTIEADDIYGGYLKVVADYHTIPTMIAGYGFSTARNPITRDKTPLTEREQGEALMEVYHQAIENGWSGVSISTWQDTWELRSWNNAFSNAIDKLYMWHDLQGDNENYGLMAFEPGEEAVCVLDGDSSEWEKDDIILTTDTETLSVRYDAEGIYLLLEGEGISPNRKLYVPIDVTPKTGSKVCDKLSLKFSREVDFVLRLSGYSATDLFVQARYDATRENFNMELGKGDPFIQIPEADTSEFHIVSIATENKYLLNEEEYLMPVKERQKLTLLGAWKTGHLVHGNGDPESDVYNSLADFCFGENCVEILIPWNMLNVGDPSGRQIHDDYYENYGVEMRKANKFYFGIAREDDAEPSEMAAFKWKGWKTVTYRERLKDSYYVIQESWR